MGREDVDFAGEIRGDRVGYLEPEVVLDLSAEDENGDAAGEADCDWIRDVFDHRAETGESHDQQDDSCHDCADEQIARAVLLADAVQDNDESAGRAANGDARTAERRNQKTSNYGGEDSGLRLDAGC